MKTRKHIEPETTESESGPCCYCGQFASIEENGKRYCSECYNVAFAICVTAAAQNISFQSKEK